MKTNLVGAIVVDAEGRVSRINSVWTENAEMFACTTSATGGYGTIEITNLRSATNNEVDAFTDAEVAYDMGELA